MAGATFNKKINLNQYRKVYPFVRVEAKNRFIADKEIKIETGEVEFSSASTGTYTFTEKYTTSPSVVITNVDTEGNDEANVNTYISAISTTSATITSSANFTGRVDLHVIEIAE